MSVTLTNEQVHKIKSALDHAEWMAAFLDPQSNHDPANVIPAGVRSLDEATGMEFHHD